MKNKYFLIGVFLFSITAHVPTARAELVVIANPKVSFNSLTQGQLRRIFFGQTRQFSNGELAEPFDVSGDYRNLFYEEVLEKSASQINTYWSNMIFSGKASPPRQIRPEDVRQIVSKSIRAISYIDRAEVNASVKIINITDDH